MNVLYTVRNELNQLGYSGNLLQEDYVFDDASTSGILELNVPLAAFAQWPPSYRNACIGVLTANGQSGPQHVSGYRTLGAPMFFEAFHDHVDRYRVEASGRPVFLESIPSRNITRAFEVNNEKWSPEAIFRAKAIIPLKTPVQLDFVDIGLLPALKGMIHDKLDRLLKGTLHKAISTYKNNTSGKPPDEALLFRLVFRFLAAKVFKDKRHPGNWDDPKANTIIKEIQRFYGFTDSDMQGILDEPHTQQTVWDNFRNAFNFQNLSVDDLAFIYENTLIRKETRKQFGIHSTPPAIAELIVDRLPFELLPEDERFVVEPCSGHGVFLVAALRRLRELLSSAWTDKERHKYLKDRLTAIEVDAFAAEVCRLSLMLADYPNPDGWQIISQDIFATDVLKKHLKTSKIVLCNPPFEDFTPDEKKQYGNRILSVHKPYEILSKVMKNPPDMFGFVLPKSAILGERYSDIQDRIVRNYKNIETIALPDRIFSFSEQETMLVLASDRNKDTKTNIFIRTFWIHENDRRPLLETGQLPEGISKVTNRSTHRKSIPLRNVPLYEIWNYLQDFPRLGAIADFHQGIWWNVSLEKNRSSLISSNPNPGFKKGLDTVQGKIEPYDAERFVYLNMDEQYRRTTAHSFPWDKPKVIANGRRISRGPWRIVGYPDSSGLVCTKNFIGIWPKSDINIEVLSAFINSPLVNAALYLKGYGRENSIRILEQIPIPYPEVIDKERIDRLITYYINFKSTTMKGLAKEPIIKILMEIDSLILKAYDLPPRLERKLLEFFRGYPRPVPFNFPNYYPEDFKPCIPLHKYLEMDLKQSSAGELLKRIKPFDSEDMNGFFMDLEAGQS
jgi:type I restriction-modification system DNA methylase subunit